MNMDLRYQVTCSTSDGSSQIGSKDDLLEAVELCIETEDCHGDEDVVICWDSKENMAIDWQKIAYETDWESLGK